MVTLETAVHQVETYLSRIGGEVECGLVVTSVRAIRSGWVFFYNSAEFLESGESQDAVGGNNPIIVDRFSGQLYETSFRTTESDIAQFPENKASLSAIDCPPREPWVRREPTISRAAARTIALSYLNNMSVEPDAVVRDDLTQEFDVGWVFSHTTDRFLRTGDTTDTNFPNDLPLIVERNRGVVFQVGRAGPPSRYVEMLRKDIHALPRLLTSQL